MKRALTIAGSDSGGGAGIQADLKTFAARGVFGMSAITALTAQNTLGVSGVLEVAPDFVGLQIDAVVTDIGTDVVKTGMLSSAPIIAIVAAKMRQYHLTSLVVDPVMIAKGGAHLLRDDARDALIQEMLPLATVVTPNLHEAQALCGFPIATVADMRRAAEAIHRLGPRYVIVKGGHLEIERQSIDVLFDGERFDEYAAPRVETTNTHGTGCTFASAIAAELAKGQPVREAVSIAKAYLTEILRASIALHLGHGHGPLNHMARLFPQD
ncbi:MAG: bifunctional hydroxymethylpyrimidine kinase/phosphomethylpyrimidine kinase [Chloroflexi bacterium]|nr:bifunctional hydroxymethylpyrimidine kinase/phosphomethylpyrimidine kinase [Chloroflexota bacterium]